jgi:hypothetical protein
MKKLIEVEVPDNFEPEIPFRAWLSIGGVLGAPLPARIIDPAQEAVVRIVLEQSRVYPDMHLVSWDNIGRLGPGTHELFAYPPVKEAMGDEWVMVPREPTEEILAAASIAAWPTASPADIEMARAAAPIILMSMDAAPGATADMIAAGIATMAPAYRAMIAAASTDLRSVVAEGDV